jgi:DNA (cytosine-5)-methyltransferase 1
VKPRLLDLFCKAGGAAVGYHRAGFEVLGVDIEPQPNYPFRFVRRDALEVLTDLDYDAVDAIHASPPCQSFTAYRRRGSGVGDSHPNLIPQVREHLEAIGVPYVIENVVGAPLRDPITLCGSSFGLDVRRHRLFETNWPCVGAPCNHAWQTPRFPPATNRPNLRRTVEVGAWRCSHLAPAAMGIDWMSNDELSEAIPPAFTEFLGRQMAAYIRARHGAAYALEVL